MSKNRSLNRRRKRFEKKQEKNRKSNSDQFKQDDPIISSIEEAYKFINNIPKITQQKISYTTKQNIRYTTQNQPQSLFNISISHVIFDVADFHIMLNPIAKVINLFVISPKDKPNEVPMFGFLHTIDNLLNDIQFTQQILKEKMKVPCQLNLDLNENKTAWIGSQILPKIQLSPNGWSTDINMLGKIRKAPLFHNTQMDPFLILQFSCETYLEFVSSLMKILTEKNLLS